MDEQEQKNKANNFGQQQQQAEEPNRHATVDYCQLLKGLQISEYFGIRANCKPQKWLNY
jgi:hypothetical protein